MNKLKLKELTDLFEKLGARDLGLWAESQLEEGINQLSRYVFLREAWKCLVDENDGAWIKSEIESYHSKPNEPGAGMGRSLQNLLSVGADELDIVQIARHAQWKLLFDICYLLDGPEELEDEIQDLSWGLFEVDGEGEIVGAIDGLYESVLDTDPTGREMRPIAS